MTAREEQIIRACAKGARLSRFLGGRKYEIIPALAHGSRWVQLAMLEAMKAKGLMRVGLRQGDSRSSWMPTEQAIAALRAGEGEEIPMGTECPACGRKVGMHAGITDMAGRPVMEFHFTAPQSYVECRGSDRAVEAVANATTNQQRSKTE